MESEIIELPIEDSVYQLRKHLGWCDTDSISTAGMRMFIDGKVLSQGIDLQDMAEIEVEIDTGARNLRRLSARLVGLKPYEIKALPRAHVIRLLKVCDELEAAEDAELGDLAPKASIVKRLKESSETVSSMG